MGKREERGVGLVMVGTEEGQGVRWRGGGGGTARAYVGEAAAELLVLEEGDEADNWGSHGSERSSGT